MAAKQEMVTIPDAEYSELLTRVSRLAHEQGSRARSEKKLRRRRDTLERAIARHATGQCRCRTDRECLVRLAKTIPSSRFEEV
jgi:hypothetical protein